MNIGREGGRADWLGFSGSIIGSIVAGATTVFAGYLAYSAAKNQIDLARADARAARYNTLVEEVRRRGKELDDLKHASSYLKLFEGHFPAEKNGSEFTAILLSLRQQFHLTISVTAINAPYGYGQRIETVMRRIREIADSAQDTKSKIADPLQVGPQFNVRVAEAVDGVRHIVGQLSETIGDLERQLLSVADERDLYAPRLPSGQE